MVGAGIIVKINGVTGWWLFYRSRCFEPAIQVYEGFIGRSTNKLRLPLMSARLSVLGPTSELSFIG